MSRTTDIDYAAVEPEYNRIRLAHDRNGHVYIMDNSTLYSAPYDTALAGELFNEKMQSLKLNEKEMIWVIGMKEFARQLSSFHYGNTCD